MSPDVAMKLQDAEKTGSVQAQETEETDLTLDYVNCIDAFFSKKESASMTPQLDTPEEHFYRRQFHRSKLQLHVGSF